MAKTVKKANKSAAKKTGNVKQDTTEKTAHKVFDQVDPENINRTPRSLVTGGKFHKFEEDPEFEGIYTGEVVTHEKDDPEMNVEEGDVRGFIFDGITEDGDLDEEKEGVVIGASHSVQKAMAQVETNAVLRFQYKGKSQGKGGKMFKNFNIDLIGYWNPATGKIDA